jgi:16S rRNA (guanine1207-N2)-methyltransferase
VPAAAAQVSPLIPGAQPLEGLEAASLAGAVVAAPPGAIERRYVLARVLRALAPGAPLVALAPGAKGGARLGKELAAFGCEVAESGRRHYRICQTVRPETPTGLRPALEAGALRFDAALGLWTQPGVFSWNRPDPGTERLLAALTPLAGAGADLGCGPGAIARALLARETVTRLALVDIDARAIAAARRNVDDPRATFHWADVRAGGLELSGLDFVVMNPPFHDGGAEDRELGQAFIRRAHGMLRRGGALWLVANRHLPYEAALRLFAQVTPRGDSGGYKLYEARR